VGRFIEKIKTGKADSIKRMKLYRYPERVYNEISAAGYEKDALLREKDIRFFDQYHYLVTDIVEDAINYSCNGMIPYIGPLQAESRYPGDGYTKIFNIPSFVNDLN